MEIYKQSMNTNKPSAGYGRGLALGVSAMLFVSGGVTGYAYENTIDNYQDAVCANMNNDTNYYCEEAPTSEVSKLEAEASHRSKLSGGLIMGSLLVFLGTSFSRNDKRAQDYELEIPHFVNQ